MDIESSFLIYLIIAILVYCFSRFVLKIRVFSSLVLALIIGLLVLSVICPFSSIERVMMDTAYPYIYSLLMLITSLVVLFYILEKALSDINSPDSPLYCWVYNSPSYKVCHNNNNT